MPVVCILHFTPGMQSAFYPQSVFYPQPAVCNPVSFAVTSFQMNEDPKLPKYNMCKWRHMRILIASF